MQVPNFLVVGAGRAGTSSLHHYLQQHPEIFIPEVKSPSYFYCRGLPASADRAQNRMTRNYFVPETRDYQALFSGVKGEKAIGEVSPAYLASLCAVERISEELPDVKIIAILRNPVDRFYARFAGRRRDGLEMHDSAGSLLDSERQQPFVRDEAVGTYLSAGFCSHFLAAYLERFSHKQLLITFTEDLSQDGQAFMQRLFEFLEVDSGFRPDLSQRYNKSDGIIRSPLMRALWTGSATARATVRPYIPKRFRDVLFKRVTSDLVTQVLDPATRHELQEIYRDEIHQLETMTARDLSHWLQAKL